MGHVYHESILGPKYLTFYNMIKHYLQTKVKMVSEYCEKPLFSLQMGSFNPKLGPKLLIHLVFGIRISDFSEILHDGK